MNNTQSISKTVLITGCSTGIGRATAEFLAKKGWTVYATARRLESIEDLRQVGCKTLALDVTDEQSIEEAVATVEREAGAVGVLVNNAGYSQSGAIESVSMADVRRQFDTNVFGVVALTQRVLPKMREQGWGKIVNISSMGAKFVFPGGGFYHGTKHALEAISDALRFEVKGFGVDVILVEPGLIRTDIAENVSKNMIAVLAKDGPYTQFNLAVEKSTAEAYVQGPFAKLGGEPESVAKVVERSISVSRPKIRYKVTPSAHILVGMRKMMTDRMWDGFMKSLFPQPGKL